MCVDEAGVVVMSAFNREGEQQRPQSRSLEHAPETARHVEVDARHVDVQ